VFNTSGWAEYGLMGEGVWRPQYMVPRKLDPSLGRISQSVGVLGMLGMTAFASMNLMASPKEGETVVVSAASGGVGQIAGQLAKQRGARVMGIAGHDTKCRFVTEELGFDACVSQPLVDASGRPRRGLPDRHRRLFRECRRQGV
jgi:NADPH-dependent curcumin reductase